MMTRAPEPISIISGRSFLKIASDQTETPLEAGLETSGPRAQIFDEELEKMGTSGQV
jgi:hypothetical protein